VAAALNNVAEIHRLQRQYAAAEPLYQQALQILVDTLGTSHPSTAVAMHNLGGFYLLQRDVTRAKQYYERALACKEAALGRNHPEYATTLFHLAEALKLEGHREDSLALLKQSLDILGAYCAASHRSLLTAGASPT
jgi:tetratricopeptide (TPR) repeat protein